MIIVRERSIATQNRNLRFLDPLDSLRISIVLPPFCGRRGGGVRRAKTTRKASPSRILKFPTQSSKFSRARARESSSNIGLQGLALAENRNSWARAARPSFINFPPISSRRANFGSRANSRRACPSFSLLCVYIVNKRLMKKKEIKL